MHQLNPVHVFRNMKLSLDCGVTGVLNPGVGEDAPRKRVAQLFQKSVLGV